MAEYIIVMRDTGYQIIGPFGSVAERRAWSAANWTLNHDPRWQSIELNDPHAAPVVLSPSDPAAVKAIQE